MASSEADSKVPGIVINDAYKTNFNVDDADDDADELHTVDPKIFAPKTRDRKQTVRLPEDPKAQGGVQQQNDDAEDELERDLRKATQNITDLEEEEDIDLDISDFNALFNKCECERQQHRLAEKYFSWRQFYYFTLPLSLVTMASGIMAFLSTSQKISKDDQISLATTVGCLSLLQIFWQTLGGKLKFDTKAEMHLGASVDLKRLADDLDFQQVEEAQKSEQEKNASIEKRKKENETTVERLRYAKRGLVWSPPPSELKKRTPGTPQTTQSNDAALEAGEKEDAVGGKDINYYRAQYAQCMSGCKSTVPLIISQAFAVMDTYLALKLTKGSRKTLEKDMGKAGYGIMYAAVCNYIYIEVTNSRGWPFNVTKPEAVVERAIKELAIAYNPKKDFFARPDSPVRGTRRWCCGTYSVESRTTTTQTQ